MLFCCFRRPPKCLVALTSFISDQMIILHVAKNLDSFPISPYPHLRSPERCMQGAIKRDHDQKFFNFLIFFFFFFFFSLNIFSREYLFVSSPKK